MTSTMGILTLAGSPVKTLKDLEGRRLGSTLQSAEVPFIDQVLSLSGVDPAKVSRVALQANVLETSLINKQVDAISIFATSNTPNFLTQGIETRFFPYADVGIRLYSNCLTTSPDYLAQNRSVVEAWADGMNEGLKYCMLNFEEAVDIFVSEVPEVKMSSTGRAHTRYGAGLFMAALLTPEIRDHGIGWADMDFTHPANRSGHEIRRSAEQSPACRRDDFQQCHGRPGKAHASGMGDRAQVGE